MTVEVKTQSQFYDIYKNEVLAQASELTDFSDGSLHDIIAGAISMLGNELAELIITNFSKTFLSLAEGEDLDTLIVDHFGESFKRPLAIKATGTVTFSRPNANLGIVVIPKDTVVKTAKDSSGQEVRFVTTAQVVMTGLSATVAVEAVIAGVEGNADIGKIKVIESTLSDSTITVTNTAGMAGGKETFTDAEYRDFAKVKLLSLSGATESAVIGAVLAVSGVAFCKIVTEEKAVIEYDIANLAPKAGAVYFRIPQSKIYISDSSGNSSQALIDSVRTAIAPVKAAGVRFDVLGAVAISISWSASLTLNPSGPFYSELSVDLIKITDTMKEYIDTVLGLGQGFNRTSADAYIMSVWGPAGTGDITSFSTVTPSSNVSVTNNQKLICGTASIV
jgi:hypothetical protein